MINDLNIFVSYTTRDGNVSKFLLEKLYNNLFEISKPFIHAINCKSNSFAQLYITKKLLSSHVLIIIESPLVYHSPWVKFELLIAKLKMMPIIKLHWKELDNPL